MSREAGVLLALSSLPGTFGIGDMGDDAYHWIDSLSDSQSTLWQLLPLNPLGYGNSPYQTYSSFAGDSIYISIENLYKDLKLEIDIEPRISTHVDYESVRSKKEPFLRNAFKHFIADEGYHQFLKDAFWLQEYAEFMTLRSANQNKAWVEWKKFEVDQKEINYHYFIQYIFDKQWASIKQYATSKSIQIIGDIPIYLGHDSAEVYFHRDWFLLDARGKPTAVAGVPPDYFSDEGQLWGNPLYNWEHLAHENYSFWIQRLKWNERLFDTIRIDHFRAFDTYWAVDADASTAAKGKWVLGPAHHFFDSVYKQLPAIDLVVEDLGDLRPEVHTLRDDYNLMGMQIIQFALKPEEFTRDDTMPHHLLIYTGTHDNEPLGAWLDNNSLQKQQQVRNDIESRGIFEENLVDAINHYTLSLSADWAIIPIQDIMRLKDETRMNRPGTIGSPNWEWKLDSLESIKDGMKRYKQWVKKTHRMHKEETYGKHNT